MVVRLILSDRKWLYQIHAAISITGKYHVILRGIKGEHIAPTPAIGGFDSLDAITPHAPHLYRQLVAMHESNSATSAINTRQHELTTRHAKEN